MHRSAKSIEINFNVLDDEHIWTIHYWVGEEEEEDLVGWETDEDESRIPVDGAKQFMNACMELYTWSKTPEGWGQIQEVREKMLEDNDR